MWFVWAEILVVPKNIHADWVKEIAIMTPIAKKDWNVGQTIASNVSEESIAANFKIPMTVALSQKMLIKCSVLFHIDQK